MPLYMDFHKFPGITLDIAKTAHTADEGVQDKFGVTFHQYWVNETSGAVFCLVEGPDKETCQAVHQTSHGNVACAMVEVDRYFFELIMGEKASADPWGLVRHPDGAVDMGHRYVLAMTVHGMFSRKNAVNAWPKAEEKVREALHKEMATNGGRNVIIAGDDTYLLIFNSPASAFQCATSLRKRILAKNKKVPGVSLSFRIALGGGQPVTENDGFFAEAIKLTRRLGILAPQNAILVSPLVSEALDDKRMMGKVPEAKVLSHQEQTFALALATDIESHVGSGNLTIDNLGRTLGISRPQLYRRIVSLTGKAPNDLLRDLRLDAAYRLLKRKKGNVSEIALETGFSNPSYFAACFAARFGCSPSAFAAVFNQK